MKYLLILFWLSVCFSNITLAQIKKGKKGNTKLSLNKPVIVDDPILKPTVVIDGTNIYNNKFPFQKRYLIYHQPPETYNPLRNPIDELRKRFSSNNFKIGSVTYNLDSVNVWLPLVIDTFKNNLRYIKLSENKDLQDPELKPYINFLDSLNEKKYVGQKWELIDYENLVSKNIKVCNPKNKIWTILTSGSINYNVSRNPRNYDSICFSQALRAQPYLAKINDAKEKAKALEFFGDYFDDFKVYDSAISYYIKSLLEVNDFSKENKFVALKIANIYEKLNFNWDSYFNVNYYYLATENNGTVLDTILQRKAEVFYDLSRFYGEINNQSIQDITRQNYYAERFLFYLDNFNNDNQFQSSLYRVISELFYVRKEYSIAANVTKICLLEQTFNSLPKNNFYQIVNRLLSLKNIYLNTDVDIAKQFMNSANKFVEIFGDEFYRLAHQKEIARFSLQLNEFSNVGHILNKIWEDSLNKKFAFPYLNEEQEKFNRVGLDYAQNKIYKENYYYNRDTLKILDTLRFYYNNRINDVTQFKNNQISTIQAERKAYFDMLLQTINEKEDLNDGLEIEKTKAQDAEIKERKAKKDAISEKINAQKQTARALNSESITKGKNVELTLKQDSINKLLDTIRLKNIQLDSAATNANNQAKIAMEQKVIAEDNALFMKFFGFISLLLLVVSIFGFNKSQKAKKNEYQILIELEKIKLEAKAALSELNPHFLRGAARRLPEQHKKLEKDQQEKLLNIFSDITTKAYDLTQQENSNGLDNETKLIENLKEYYNLTDHKANPVKLVVRNDETTKSFLENAQIPPMVLFNTVENALTKAFPQNFDKTKLIEICAKNNNGNFELSIIDNGQGFNISEIDKTKGGIGKNEKLIKYHNNIATRGNKINISIQSTKGIGTSIIYKFS